MFPRQIYRVLALKPSIQTAVMAYFHFRGRIQTLIPLLCRIFPLVQIWTLIP